MFFEDPDSFFPFKKEILFETELYTVCLSSWEFLLSVKAEPLLCYIRCNARLLLMEAAKTP